MIDNPVCDTCRFKIDGHCQMPEEDLVDLLENGYCSEHSCSKYKPRPDGEYKWGEDTEEEDDD